MHDQINGPTTAGTLVPVYKFLAVDGDHPLTGVPFGPILTIIGASKVLQQGDKFNISYLFCFFSDMFKRIIAAQAWSSSSCNFSY